jgi:hypothetical protein
MEPDEIISDGASSSENGKNVFSGDLGRKIPYFSS